MYSRTESSQIKAEFWTTFGRYMKPVLSSEGLRINWINYNTSLKDVYFRMDASHKSARIFISMEQPDQGMQELFFQQFEELKGLLHSILGEEWDWQQHQHTSHGKPYCYIGTELEGVSIFNQDHWPQMISFFKPRIIALDSFWEDARYSFDALR